MDLYIYKFNAIRNWIFCLILHVNELRMISAGMVFSCSGNLEGSKECVRLLVNAGADIEITDFLQKRVGKLNGNQYLFGPVSPHLP